MPATGKPLRSSTGAASMRRPPAIMDSWRAKPRARIASSAGRSLTAARNWRIQDAGPRLHGEHPVDRVPRKVGQNGPAYHAHGGGNGGADANVEAKPHPARAHALDIDDVTAFNDAEARRLADLADQRTQNWLYQAAQIFARHGVKPEIEHLEGQPETSALGNTGDIAEIDQRVQHAEGRPGIQPRGTGDFAQRHCVVVGGKRLKNPEPFGQGLHRILQILAAVVRARPHGA